MGKQEQKISLDSVLESIKLTERTIDNLNYTRDEYYQYINEIHEKENFILFLETLKILETLESNRMESIDSFKTLFTYYQSKSKTPIDVFLEEKQNNGNQLDEAVLNTTHKNIPTDINSEKKGKYRNTDCWVGGYVKGVPKVEYIPPNPIEIPENMEQLYRYYNDDTITSSCDDVLIKPLIIHAMVARVQPYFDGNKRISRLLMSVKNLELTNKQLNINVSSPILYLSQNYKLYRSTYVGNLVDLYNYPNSNEHWNKWFNFNLNCINEQMDYFKRCISTVEKSTVGKAMH